MAIQFTCPHCGMVNNVADDMAVQTSQCTYCGKGLNATSPEEAALSHEEATSYCACGQGSKKIQHCFCPVFPSLGFDPLGRVWVAGG